MIEQRASGILLHPTSLPSLGGIGDLGPAAYEFVDFLARANQTLWQVLPLAPVGMGNSPYSSTSAFAGNTLLISLDRLADRGFIARDRLKSLPESSCVDYERVMQVKLPLLREAAQNFLAAAKPEQRVRYQSFVDANSWWLEDYVLFDALRRRHGGESWNKWLHELAHRSNDAMHFKREELREELEIERFLQFAFFEQWHALRQYCASRGIRIIGDIAIFVSYDSADVWTHPDIFRLNADTLEPQVVAGVPPDAFSATGQRWGNPLYDWEKLRSRNYDWWVSRVRWALEMCDIIRLDHFRGFEQYWEIPASEPTAVHGHWVDGPKDDLFRVFREQLGDLPFIAEDLGMITAEVHALRQRLNIPGMRVMQFGFSDPGAHIYLPQQFEPRTVVYTGTHDNDTTVGWWNSLGNDQKRLVRTYLGEAKDGMSWSMIRSAAGSVAQLMVVPLQDVLNLGNEARMNVPSRIDGNWAWRYQSSMLTNELAEKLKTLTEVSDRAGAAKGESRVAESDAVFAA